MRRTTALLLIVGWATFLAGLGRPAIGDSDEAFYAEAAREMLDGGDWLTPHYSHQLRFQKPILTYWLIAATYKVAGVHEAAARLWPAVAGVALALLTVAIARRAYRDEAAAGLAGAIVATSFGYFSVARLSLPDLPLAAFVTLATWAAFRASLDPDGRRGTWWLTCGVAAGLGVLTKGPVALVLVLLVVLPALWRERAPLGPALRGAAFASGIALAIAAPWFAAMTLVHGSGYLTGFLVGDNLERFATPRFNDPRPWWFYLPILAGGLLPWTALSSCAAAPLVRWWRRGASHETWRLAWWALAPLLFFTASVGKQPRYILPVLPPLAVLLARALREYLQTGSEGRRRPTIRIAGFATAVLLVVLAVLLYRAQPVVVYVEPWLVRAGAAAIGCGGVGLGAISLFGRAHSIPIAVAAAGTLALVGLQYGLSPAGRDPVQDMAARVVAARSGQEPVGTYRVFVRNLVYYTRVPSEDLTTVGELRAYLDRSQRVLCVMRSDDLDALGPVRPRVRVLATVLYLNASAVRLRTLISPDPARDLEPVVLVTNR